MITNMLLRAALAAFCVALASACGGTTTDGSSGGAGGSGGTGAGGSGGTGGTPIPPECRVDATGSPPYPVTLQFVNHGDRTLYLHQGCTLELAVTACTDGYTEPLTITATCTGSCTEAGCVVCGACFDGPLELAPHTTGQEYVWSGNTFVITERQGCPCHTAHAAPAGRYRVRAPVFESELDVQERRPAHFVEADFTLPATNGVVVLPIHGG
jgi:hypothetical protein